LKHGFPPSFQNPIPSFPISPTFTNGHSEADEMRQPASDFFFFSRIELGEFRGHLAQRGNGGIAYEAGN
jgi:hypothetical protein